MGSISFVTPLDGAHISLVLPSSGPSQENYNNNQIYTFHKEEMNFSSSVERIFICSNIKEAPSVSPLILLQSILSIFGKFKLNILQVGSKAGSGGSDTWIKVFADGNTCTGGSHGLTRNK